MHNSDLFIAFKSQLEKLTSEGAVFKIALSGGLDSVVLLHLFSRLENRCITAHHIDHGLSDNAHSWTQFCEKLCHSLSVPFVVTKVILDKKNRTSLEALAREKRYVALKEGLTNKCYLVTAHHQDDQLETVLLALKRGAGLTGLQGIVAKQSLSVGYLIRPLLNFSREQLESYALQFKLTWIEDESNADQRFDRNFIRHTITPLLKKRWPAIAKTVARSASHCQSQMQLINEITETDLQTCLSDKQQLKIERLKVLTETRRNNVLRGWFKNAEFNYPSTKQLTAIWADIAFAQTDAMPKIVLAEVIVCRYRGTLHFVDKNSLVAETKKVVWQGEKQLTLCTGELTLTFDVQSEFIKELHHVEICFRNQFSSDLKCQPIGRDKSRSIKKLLHEHHVPPWFRDRVPFVFIDGLLLEAVGLWRCEIPYSTSFYTFII
ncbi:tRNA lysidine(34) synthetase TilS [Psychromonas hadalis]|uniref:tRNA lysidine(34) synthetase TilS n=1 Tax=Psychromonas hadalis TaxID=211669 RepID=UPI0003B4975D|nr:tRNA lysidine(34) synthetase TilS [Psychromonas hadalis]